MSKRFLAAALLFSVSIAPALAAKTSLVIGMPIEPPGLDPTIAAPVAIREVTWANLYEGLVRIDRDGRVQPLLAKSWDISPDGLTYTFRLQPGVKFHDGTAFDSADVKFAFDRARAPTSTNAQKQIFAPIDTIETPDPLTVVIKLKEPSGNFLYYLGWGDAVVVAPETAENNKANPVGTGPFKFKSWTRGDKVELVRNADYWQKDKTKLESVTFRFISDPQAQVAALRAGDVDAFPNLGAPELFTEFKKDARFKAVVGNTEGEIVAGMNNAKKPFDDVRVRRALMHAIDRMALVEGAYSGYGQPIGGFFSPNHPAFVDLTRVVPYDPAKAKALLAEAGYGKGLSITIKVPQMAYASRSAELLSAMLAEVGVEMKIIPTEFPAKWIEEVFKAKDYDVTIVAHAEPLDIDIFARDNYYFNYKNDKFKALIADIAKTTDEKMRFAKYGEAQKILAEDVPALFLFQLPKLGVWNAKLKGLWENSPIPSNDVTDASWSD
ncbi:ABC transporter substrate-binding protein [Microvirga terricola]|uniref:ABC transporter substrate-binding protein n=1 Tax=Microvirga terricola TaxID=2719797 RepID=A0ABX0VD04_9HYPH|nr:ABC transporter substrate-binding protein [Microvirga terricola]NIX77044.1 ABC transporter substrate-binding protein [Microvirga terricola]